MTTARCKHDLMTAWCAICTPKKSPPSVWDGLVRRAGTGTQSDIGKVFTASFDGGECGECGGLLAEGDEIRYVGAELWHATCAVTEEQNAALMEDARREASTKKPARKMVDLDTHADTLKYLRAAKVKVAEWEDVVKLLRGQLEEIMGAAEDGMISGDEDPVVTWRWHEKSSFDAKRFRADHPELASKYTTPKRERRFVVSDPKRGTE